MAQNKTTLILNNLAELTFPIKSSRYIQIQGQKQSTEITVQLPFLALLQKIDMGHLQRSESHLSQARTPKIQQILRLTASRQSQQLFQEIIDFKKHKISYQFKSRIRSNSNEFIDGIPFYSSSSSNRKRTASIKTTLEDSSPHIIDDDDSDEETRDTLVCGVANTFKVIIENEEGLSDDLNFLSLKLSVWPTMRMPTGTSTIPLINTMFLFSSRGHVQESQELDLLVAQSLVNGRKFIQASEKFRAIQSLLLQKNNRDDLYRSMLIEMIIGESMSQHSQISEKVFAFKRATFIHSQLLFDSIDFPNVKHSLSQITKEIVKQEDAPQKLLSIKQSLVQIIIQNLNSHIEVVRNAMLKTLEYLLDALNCSLEFQIVNILKAVCFCYPDSPSVGAQTFNQSCQPEVSLGFFQFKFSQQKELTMPVPFFSLYSIHSDRDCLVKDVKTQSQLYIQSTKNSYNHILENLSIVLASASHNLLLAVFKHVIIPDSFNQQLPQELRVYLLKFANQILQVCSNDIIFPGAFLTELIEVILETPKRQTSATKAKFNVKMRNRAQSAATQAVSPHFNNLQQVCNQLFQTMNAEYFSKNQNSNTGQQMDFEYGGGKKRDLLTFDWLMQNLQTICQSLKQREATQNQVGISDFRRLNLFLGIVDNVVQTILLEQKNSIIQSESVVDVNRDKLRAASNARLQFLFNREDQEANNELTFGSKSYENNINQQVRSQDYSQSNHFGFGQNKMQSNLLYLQVFLPLTQPLIKLLNFSVASQERLTLFRQVWRLLTQVLSQLPVNLTKMQNLTLPNLIRPHLTKLTLFMQKSSPSKQMLEFLHIVISSVELQHSELEDLIFPTLLKTIPHNLHDEAFKVTSLMLDLLKGPMKKQNLKLLISVLVHKYTMRSKEHKLLVDKVVQKVLLGRNSRQIFDLFLTECLFENVLQQGSVSPDEEAIHFEKLGLLWEVVVGMSRSHVWHFRKILNSSLDSIKRVFHYNNRSQHFVVKLLYKLTQYFLKHCAAYHHYEHLRMQQQPAIVLSGNINAQFARIPPIRSQINFYQNQAAIYSEPSAELFSIGHHEDDFYAIGGLEDPHVEMDPQVAAYLIPEVEPTNRRQRIHYQSQHVEYQPQALFQNLVAEDEIEQQSELYESPRQAPQYANQTISNDIALVNRDRQILIKMHACLIKPTVDGDLETHAQSFSMSRDASFFNQHQSRQNQSEDVNSRLCALNLMLNLFSNLMPLPTLQNLVVHEIISQDREQINLVEPVRMLYFQDDDEGQTSSEHSILAEENKVQPEQAQFATERAGVAHVQNEGARQQNQEVIPELADLIISGEQGSDLLEEEETSFPSEFECINAKYICSRILMFLNVSKYLEHTIKTSSWASLKSLAISVLVSACQIPDVAILPPKLQRHFKNSVQPLLVRLLQTTKDCEAKATALSIIAGLCNLQLKQSNTIDLNDLKFDQDLDSKDDLYAQENLRAWQQSSPPQISQHLRVFSMNASFISVAIWQAVFDLQDNQNQFIREAASAIIQLCAPAESVKHFQKIRYEQYKLKANELLQNSLFYFQENQYNEGFTASGELETSQSFLNQSSLRLQMDTSELNRIDDDSSQQSQSSFLEEPPKVTNEMLMRILGFFQIQCRPLTSLLAERTQYQREQAIENSVNQVGQRVTNTRQDFFEDGLLLDDRFQLGQNRSRQKGAESYEDDDDESLDSSSSDEVYIFRRQESRNRFPADLIAQSHNDSKQSGSNVFFASTHLAASQVQSQDNNEDLGIIDLDNCEMTQEDDFDELDDEKLPVLKNIYSKKNRPNNSKSVAVGSRSQGGALKPRQMSGKKQLLITEEGKEEDFFKDEQASVSKNQSDNQLSVKQIKKAIRTSLEAKDEELNDALISDLQLESRSSFQIIRRSEKEVVKVVEIDSTSGEKISVVSLPVAGRRQIQSAGGKRGDQNATSSRDKRQNLHFLSQGDSLYIPTNMENVDIEEVQIFVRQKRNKRLRTQTSQQQNSRNDSQLLQAKSQQQQNPALQQQQSTANML